MLLRSASIPQFDSTDGNDNYEPYDPRLAEKLRLLYAEFEVQSTRVAELRREAPGAAARQCVERLEEELKIENDLERHRRSKGEDVAVMPLDVRALERIEDIERAWGKGAQGLVQLGDISTVLAKLERAGQAVEVVEGI